jgi:hypothetical protein
MEEIKYVYVVCENSMEFLEYVKKNDGAEFIHVVDGTTLRERVAGEIVKIGNYQNRWNYQDIAESIERAYQVWGDPEIEDNIKGIDYGTGE